MEILAELFFVLLQFLAELVLQIVFEVLVELGLRSVHEPFRRPKPLHPSLAALGYAIFGAIAGGISIWLLPTSFIETQALRIVNLVVTPVVAGAVMAGFGAWRRRREEELIRLDRFTYGFVFALAMSVVRFFYVD